MKSKLASILAVGLFALFAAAQALAQNTTLPVSQLPTATAITGTEYVPIVQSGTTRKTAVQSLFGALQPSNIPILDINSKTSGVLGSTRGGAGSVLGLLKADGEGGVSSANLLDFTGDAYAYQYPNIDPTGATDSRAGIQAMIDATSTLSPVQKRRAKIVFGPGVYKVTDAIKPVVGQTIQCAGRYVTQFLVPSDFNMSAHGVIVLPVSDSSRVKDCTITFTQPTPVVGQGTGSISGNTLTIDASPAPTGTFSVGDTLAGAGVLGQTRIAALGTGGGGAGTYITAGAAQTVGSTTIRALNRSALIHYPPAIYAETQSTEPILENVRVSNAWLCGDFQSNVGHMTVIGEYECGSAAPYEYAEFSASAAAGVLTVSSVASGEVKRGGATRVEGQTYLKYYIGAQLSGPTGGAGTYQLDDASLSFSNAFPTRQIRGGTVIAGAVSFVHFTTQCWPYGWVGDGATLQGDGQSNCVAFGRIDGLNAHSISTYLSNIVFAPDAANQSIPYIVETVQSDATDNGFLVYGGDVHVVAWYSTKPGTRTAPIAKVLGASATLRVSTLKSVIDTAPYCAFEAAAGELEISGGIFTHTNTASPAACATGGKLIVRNTIADIPVANRTVAFFSKTSGSMQLYNNRAASAPGASTGNIASWASDTALDAAVGNNFLGWPHSVPATALGNYYFDEADPITIPVAAFTTGDAGHISINTWAGWFLRQGPSVKAHVEVDMTSAAYTTEAGAFALSGMGLPSALSKDYGCIFNDASKITSGAIQFFPFIQGSVIFFRAIGSGTPSLLMGISHFTQNTTNMKVGFDCDYRVR